MTTKRHWTILFLLLVSQLLLFSFAQNGDFSVNAKLSGVESKSQPRPPLIEAEEITNDQPRLPSPTRSKTKIIESNQICSLCMDMYTKANEEEFQETKDSKVFCIRLLQVQKCLKDLRAQKVRCNFMQVMMVKGIATVQQQRQRCNSFNITVNDLDNIFTKKTKVPKEINVAQHCPYTQPNKTLSRAMHCGLFGDPHIKTFFDVRQTCVVDGRWSLLENDHMAIEVTNEIVQTTKRTTVSATDKIKILFKEFDLVCTEEKLFVATARFIPDKFEDGSTETGLPGCLTRIVKHSKRHVTISSCRTNTTIVLRRIGSYLTFSIQTPHELVNKSTGLCTTGCPPSELVDYKTFLKNSLSQEQKPDITTNMVGSQDQAVLDDCLKSNLTDFYYDSCVFDLLTTGDKHFLKAAKYAMFDAQSMDPKLRLRRENSVALTVLQQQRKHDTPSTAIKTTQCFGFLSLLFTLLFFDMFTTR